MSNLIPSLETFAKAGRRSVHSFVSPSVFHTTPQAERILLALLGYFQAVFLRLVAHGFVYIGDGCDGGGIEHVGSVFTRLLVLLTRFKLLTSPVQEWACSTMARTFSSTPAHSRLAHGKVSFPPRPPFSTFCSD